MSPRQRRYLLLEQGVGAGIVNFVLNAAIAWLMFRAATTVPMWGQQSVGGDTIATAFLLPFLTTLIVSRIVRGHVRRGHVTAFAWHGSRLGDWMPAGLGRRGAVLGLLAVVTVGVPATALLAGMGVVEMSVGGFVAFKALFGAALATIVTPLIARAALEDG